MKILKHFLLSIFILTFLFAVASILGCDDVADETYAVTYIAGEGGYIKGNTEQEVNSGCDAQEVIAIPFNGNGYEFVKWSDGLTIPKRQDKNVTENISVSAEFKKKESNPEEQKPIYYTISYLANEGGTIEGIAEQQVEYGTSAQPVKAVPDEGYEFVKWSDGVTTPERQDKKFNFNVKVTAIFEKITLTVRYECKSGMLSIKTASGSGFAGPYVDFKVKYGEDCEKIISVRTLSSQNQRFVGWADGIETEERQEKNVTSDITIRAKFGYELNYKIASGKGEITGNSFQLIEDGEWSEPVEAVAEEGYVFTGWSDMVMDTTHKLTYRLERSQEYVAYFEPIERTFKYDYGTQTPLKTEITVNREKLNEAVFEIPQRHNLIFRGWYADNNYSLKVVHESGKLMLGLQTLNLDTDTLYARWEKAGEEKKTYKILMIMVDEIYATLYSTKIKDDVLVDYKMSGVERKLCSVIPPKFSQYLNKWFEGKVIFEIDTYFTREVINDGFIAGLNSNGSIDYDLMGDAIAEINDIISEYECTLVTHGFGDNVKLVHNMSIGGVAFAKHGAIYLEGMVFKNFPNQIIIEQTINFNGNGEVDENYRGLTTLETYTHEFIHTIELRYYYNKRPEFEKYTEEVYEFHKWFKPENVLEGHRLFLLHQAVVDGEYIGIPTSYWEDFYN